MFIYSWREASSQRSQFGWVSFLLCLGWGLPVPQCQLEAAGCAPRQWDPSADLPFWGWQAHSPFVKAQLMVGIGSVYTLPPMTPFLMFPSLYFSRETGPLCTRRIYYFKRAMSAHEYFYTKLPKCPPSTKAKWKSMSYCCWLSTYYIFKKLCLFSHVIVKVKHFHCKTKFKYRKTFKTYLMNKWLH